MSGSYELMLAFLLDLAIGDPRFLPHPVRIMGKAIIFCENLLLRRNNKIISKASPLSPQSSPSGGEEVSVYSPPLRGGDKGEGDFADNFLSKAHMGEKAKGVLLVLLVVLPSGLITMLVEELLRSFDGGLLMFMGRALIVYLICTTLALRELVASAMGVIDALKSGMAADARARLGMIVGRDTEDLSDDGVLRATIETLSENLSDGVVAPVFYFCIGGLPLAIAYKAVNTLDSMVGYKNERYVRFGWASARLDDIANYIPARISGLLIALASFIFFRSMPVFTRSIKMMIRDGRNHTSPNSGMPEAAMAGAVGVRLGGPSRYSGMLVEKPYIGDINVNDYLSASRQAVSIVFASSVMSVGVAVLFLFLRGLL